MKSLGYAFFLGAVFCTCSATVSAGLGESTGAPVAPELDTQAEPVFVRRADIYDYRALDSYSEPDYVSEFVAAGKLPPVDERLPAEPLVYRAGNMPDGLGVYGGTLRHVIGGRPEGWNFWGGQSQGWGGITIHMTECLTRTGPLFMVTPNDLEPMPNLAKSWQWSADGKTLIVNLIEGAKWSDGDPFDTADIDFYWNDIVMNPELSPLMGANQDTYSGAALDIVDKYRFRMTFDTAFTESLLYSLAYGSFCPGPSHVLKPHHPNHGGESYEAFINAFPPESMGFPVMGAWVPVEYRPDDIIVFRRNPYYWKVDESGQQLPYLDEVHYRLSTWADRDTQTVAGTGDFSNLEQTENYLDAVRRSAEPSAPARLAFGPRTIGFTLYPNLSGNGWGDPDPRAQAVRLLNRNISFRVALSQSIDRERVGSSLVGRPYTIPYPGGLYAGTSYYDKGSTVFYSYNLESAKALFKSTGLVDTDSNGFFNWPRGSAAGAGDVEIEVSFSGDYLTDTKLAQDVVAMLEEVGIRASLLSLTTDERNASHREGRFDLMIFRNERELITVVQQTERLAPIGPKSLRNHHANIMGELDLLHFEEKMVSVVEDFMGTRIAAERTELMKKYQNLYTENLLGIGLTAYPAALLVNKRFANVPTGTPVFMYNWAEDSVIRERMYVPLDAQQDYELHPRALATASGPQYVE